jgi:hypothetical protein
MSEPAAAYVPAAQLEQLVDPTPLVKKPASQPLH